MKHRSTAEVIDLADHKRAQSEGRLELSDGAIATLEDGGLALRDRGGRLLVRYHEGSAEIAAPDGDLVLSSPEGRVVVRSGLDVEIEAGRDLVQRAAREMQQAVGREEPQLRVGPRTVEVNSDRVAVTTQDATLTSGVVSTVARVVSTKADQIAINAEKYELAATRLFEKSRDAFREVVDLAQSRMGRVKTVVATSMTMHTGRTVMTSKEETSIDGRKISLG